MNPPPLSARQADALRFIIAHLVERHYAPPVRALAAGLGLSSSHAAHLHMAALRRKGYVARQPGASGLTVLRWSDGLPFQIRAVRPEEEPAPCESASTTSPTP